MELCIFFVLPVFSVFLFSYLHTCFYKFSCAFSAFCSFPTTVFVPPDVLLEAVKSVYRVCLVFSL